jgi:hypothetical protein
MQGMALQYIVYLAAILLDDFEGAETMTSSNRLLSLVVGTVDI